MDKAVHYLEPEDIRDNFKELLKKFNKSLNIVLPDEAALEYKDDFSLYNEIRLEARNAYVAESLKITKNESIKLQGLIDEHLRAKGVTSLMDKPVSIIDVEKFEEEINNTRSGKSKELKISNRLRHKIKVELDNNPDFYQPLSQRLEELIEMRRKNQISQMELFKEFDQIKQKILNISKEAENMGFSSEREFAVYKTLEKHIDHAKENTDRIFQTIQDELSITDWELKSEVTKSMRVKIKEVLRGKVAPAELQSLTVSLVDLIKGK